jgi:hypothetical protein
MKSSSIAPHVLIPRAGRCPVTSVLAAESRGKASGAETLIMPTSSSVWNVLTDAANLTAWNSGIAEHRCRHPSWRHHPSQDAMQRPAARTATPGTGHARETGLPLGLRTRARFFLTTSGLLTGFHVKEDVSGPLLLLLSRTARQSSVQSLGWSPMRSGPAPSCPTAGSDRAIHCACLVLQSDIVAGSRLRLRFFHSMCSAPPGSVRSKALPIPHRRGFCLPPDPP